jgi:tRNA (cmo5U34)-methyltransferase
MPAPEWSDPRHVERYPARAGGAPLQVDGDSTLLELLPPSTLRILDLGTGDGRLLGLLLERLSAARGVGLDDSPPMLEAARARFADEPRAELVEHDLAHPLGNLGRFDAVVSSLAIHHLEHDRKRSLYAEAFALLEPGGIFANFDHVARRAVACLTGRRSGPYHAATRAARR